jgi:hypothetical protein
MIHLSNVLPDGYVLPDTVRLDAFNLIPGAAIILAQTDVLPDMPSRALREAVVMKITRDGDSEFVHIIGRFTDSKALFGTDDDLPRGSRFGDTFSLSLDYCDKVHLFGLNINPNDTDDDNNGND